ncbi:hypothetical protein GTO89_02640 [Heliobacterium gestii]|uniref:Uncharacterized protein n=1 Tax=Heliomicrobium gestii TaxID=2699 RepID=A0A845L8L2_HELGE|nr:O-methyltransferase [Heliomicrobium gestii]MBM7865682.1 hypothetical protein [Heliomicrobium gestii]MZP41931.1 hypothetical protein [Heliomicrobium gestii]
MSNSGEKIDYSLRPAKCIERKMICDVLNLLRGFSDIQKYRYIGFGSFYFVDFTLFHKELGINDMVSIEGNDNIISRAEFNKPYNFIDLHQGFSTQVLEIEIPWTEDKKSIIWMDYDSTIERYMLDDIEIIFERAVPGSIFLMTLNTSIGRAGNRLEFLKEKLENKCPIGLQENRFITKNDAYNFMYDLINNNIVTQLRTRNSTINEKVMYQQLFNFRYADGAPMLTIGGIIYKESEQNLLEKCDLFRYEFVKTDENHFDITVPCLTLKEKMEINKNLYSSDNNLSDILKKEDIQQYQRLYRYFPHYFDAVGI